MVKEKTRSKENSGNGSNQEWVLVILNDEHNSFQHVIDTLVKVCSHDPYQAEQCALIAHSKGSCQVKVGRKPVVESMRKRLTAEGLTAIIE